MNSADSNEDPVAQLIELSRKHGCTPDEIKAAYLGFAEQLHPDHGGNAEQFQRLQREYEVALARTKRGYIVPTGAQRFVPRPIESSGLDRKYFVGGVCALVVLALVGFLMEPTWAIPIASILGAAAIFVLLPMIMASSTSHIVGLILIVVVPISFALLVGAVQGKRFSEGDSDLPDLAINSLVLPAAAALLASIVGLLFWLVGDRK